MPDALLVERRFPIAQVKRTNEIMKRTNEIMKRIKEIMKRINEIRSGQVRSDWIIIHYTRSDQIRADQIGSDWIGLGLDQIESRTSLGVLILSQFKLDCTN